MKAAVLYELSPPLRVEEVDLDNPKSKEVRVKIAANGVCHAVRLLLAPRRVKRQ